MTTPDVEELLRKIVLDWQSGAPTPADANVPLSLNFAVAQAYARGHAEGTAEERERCACLVEDEPYRDHWPAEWTRAADRLASAIRYRRRSQAKEER